MMLPIPVSRYLVPEPADGLAALPSGFAVLDEAIMGGLPHRATLEAGLTITLVLPTGLAREWLRADGHAVVAAALPETLPGDADLPRPPRRAAPRLIVRGAAGALLGVVPLSVGVVRRVGDSGGAGGVLVNIVVLGFDLRAGNAHGPGDWGGRITLGWRRVDKGTNTFEPPPLNPYVLGRLPQPRESLFGTAAARENEMTRGADGREERYERARARWRERRRIGRKRRQG